MIMNLKAIAVVAFCVALVGGLVAAQKSESKCRYCGSASYGMGCRHSPTGKHEHRDDYTRCEWCGLTSYGAGCRHSPTGKHRHGPGSGKCIWCGLKSTGVGCRHSPTGHHEK